MNQPLDKMKKADLNALLPEADRFTAAKLRKVTVATLQAMVRRKLALNGRNKDRLIFPPVKRAEDLKLPRPGTKRALIVQALADGVTVEELAARLGWSKAVAGSALYVDVKPLGLGVERKDGILWLVMPKDYKAA